MYRLGRVRLMVLLLTFLSVGAETAILTNSYLTIPWRIRGCSLTPPRRDLILADCADVSTKFYYSGSLYLGIERPLIDSLASADVVIIGNSRTQRSFATAAVDEYFRKKGIRYFILGSEGSGFRFTQLMLERLNIKPKILLTNSEIFFVDVLEDSNRDVVLDPDRFFPMMATFYHSKQVAQPLCESGPAFLQNLYCHGSMRSNWRDPRNGALYIYYADEGARRILLHDIPETRLHYFDFYMKNARAFLASPSVSTACMINYIVPSLDSSVDLARAMAKAIGVPFVFPEIKDYYSFDGSHMWPESSERWSAEFVKLADPYIDQCM
jgi:hypothetical protein